VSHGWSVGQIDRECENKFLKAIDKKNESVRMYQQ
jgi:hypothetical protein